ncbi:hypothetical protein B4U84_12430 [Westiellopsis prolifica IICB1]|nr:hypothetical protein B4U84_12430 [Westiellopsis prolifica IICB1]
MVQESRPFRGINRKSNIQNPQQESRPVRGVNPKSKILLEDDHYPLPITPNIKLEIKFSAYRVFYC